MMGEHNGAGRAHGSMTQRTKDDTCSEATTTEPSMRMSEAATKTSSSGTIIVSSDVPLANNSAFDPEGAGLSFPRDRKASSASELGDGSIRTFEDPYDNSISTSKATRQGDGALTSSDRTDDDDDALPIRRVVGEGTVQLSDWMNSNLIVARYAAYAGIGLLAAYGVSHSPIFFRYRTVADISPTNFVRRRKLRCRVVGPVAPVPSSDKNGSDIVDSSSSSLSSLGDWAGHGAAGPIRFQVRHLSFFERYCLMPSSWFDNWMRMHPSRFHRPDQNRNELLTIELAGVLDAAAAVNNDNAATTAAYDNQRQPPSSSSPPIRSTDHIRFDPIRTIPTPPPETSRCDSFLQRLVKDGNKPVVTVQLVARRTFDGVSKEPEPSRSGLLDGGTTANTHSGGAPRKRRIPDHMMNSGWKGGGVGSDAGSDTPTEALQQVAVAKVTYRSHYFQLFPTDLAHQLVRSGLAVTSSDDGLFAPSLPHVSTANVVGRISRIVDTDRSLSTLRKDARYVSLLDAAEHDAARDYKGLWSDPSFRTQRNDVVDEVEFQATAPWWKKAWRFLRGA